MFTKAFAVATAERMVRAFAAALLSFVGADVVDVFHVDYERAAGVSLGASVVSLLFCLVGSQTGTNPGPAFLAEKITPVPPGKNDAGYGAVEVLLVVFLVLVIVYFLTRLS